MLTATNLSYRYQYSEVLQQINLSFESGKMYAIVGKSGSGKTTLLSLLSGISTLQEGDIQFQGASLTKGSLDAYRKKISIVFQSYNLINYLSPLQNVILALDINRKKGNKKQLATTYLNKVGLAGDQLTRPCKELSGGQQQ
ncbi:ATP-binding cassette domain-containing protein [Candidatus Enterococcus huntleyi]|uniref:ATP-binding cassette domain-containing protein n=1 Tax=Candidatus Enterococcus huntleyi TaxID=1857217 RepID=UPI00137A33AE|nr:ATP-binding cassette domain-containing protein [Enterococcus sp. JM4C]